jgi:DNA-binding transcriptional regulator YiaG
VTPTELKEARATLGMTQRQLADALELSGTWPQHTVRSWENGKRPITGPARVAIRLMLKHHKPRKPKAETK